MELLPGMILSFHFGADPMILLLQEDSSGKGDFFRPVVFWKALCLRSGVIKQAILFAGRKPANVFSVDGKYAEIQWLSLQWAL